MENINYDFMFIQRIPSRNKIWRNEEADPRHENKQGSGDVVVEDELETSSLDVNLEPANWIISNFSPFENIIWSLKLHETFILNPRCLNNYLMTFPPTWWHACTPAEHFDDLLQPRSAPRGRTLLEISCTGNFPCETCSPCEYVW